MNNTKRRVSCPQLTKLTLILTLLLGWGSQAWGDAKELPYEYDFNSKNNTSIVSDGWSFVGYGSTGVATFGGVGGSYCFRFYPNESVQYLYTPQLKSSKNNLVVSFSYKGYGSSYPVEFYVGYKATAEDDFTWGEKQTYASTTYTTFEETYPAGTSYIAVKYDNSTSNYYLFIDDFHAEEANPYPAPTNFSVDSYDASSATFSWVAGNSETKWQYDYSTNPDFTPGTGINGTSVSITDNPYTLSGLTTGTTYYASIRADYGSSNYSEWTEKVSFTATDELEIDVNNISTTTNAYVPINGNSVKNNLTRSQFIIPYGKLSDINGRQITKLTLYSSTSSTNYQNWNIGSAEFEVYLKEVSGTSYTSTTMSDWGTKVFNSGTLSVSDYVLEINLNTPYNYNGGNLQIGFKQTTKASETKYFPWVVVTGVSQSARYSTDNSAASYAAANPKITFTTIPANTDPVQMGENGFTTYASSRKLDLTEANLPSGLKAYKAESVSGNIVRFTEIDQTVSANTGILLKGTANTTYKIPVVDSGTEPEGNLLKVNTTGSTFTADGDYTYFGMKKATSSSDQLTFATFAPGTVAIPANKAYLEVLTSSLAEARALTCVFDDEETTGISDATRLNDNGQLINDNCFDLQGRRVAQPTKGLYIVNGKKYVVK